VIEAGQPASDHDDIGIEDIDDGRERPREANGPTIENRAGNFVIVRRQGHHRLT
jgi:hypothetical protein